MDDILSKRRQKHNNDLLRRLQNGESTTQRPETTWFPPRPSIKKDSKLVAALYCADKHNFNHGRCDVCGTSESDKAALKIIT